MYPIMLNLSNIRILLVGSGELFDRRKQALLENGATKLVLFEDTLPEAHEIRQANVVMIVGLDDQTSAVLASIGRLQGVLVHVEDKNELCDFYCTSFIKRGDLTIAVSTAGASPTLGQEIRSYLANIFCEEWGYIVDKIGKKRLEWKGQGLKGSAIGEKTRALIKQLQLFDRDYESHNTHHSSIDENLTYLTQTQLVNHDARIAN